ncbi:hypothetical protein B0H13DRAFT_1854428 [Mycena leptocephala]|nr:hypothetical protein B0H13DRAFT_1854428 [Mycena leptocephala]
MPFFENATNFKVTGGTFNVVAGDLNRHDHYYSNFTSNTYSDYPEDISNHQYYDPYAEWSPRGRHPAHHRSQRRQQEQGPYGYAEYYDDRQSESQGYYEGGYEGYEPPPPHRFESSLHSPRHVEITEGSSPRPETGTPPNIIVPMHRKALCMNQKISSRRPRMLSQARVAMTTCKTIQNWWALCQHWRCIGLICTLDLHPDTPMSDEESPDTSTAVPAAVAADLPTQKPLTTVEKMRMAMAQMEIDAADQPHAVEEPPPVHVRVLASEGKPKSTPSFSKVFQLRPKRKS